jgi:hypothetical protein
VRERYLGTRMKYTAPSIVAEQAGLSDNGATGKHAGVAAAEQESVTT